MPAGCPVLLTRQQQAARQWPMREGRPVQKPEVAVPDPFSAVFSFSEAFPDKPFHAKLGIWIAAQMQDWNAPLLLDQLRWWHAPAKGPHDAASPSDCQTVTEAQDRRQVPALHIFHEMREKLLMPCQQASQQLPVGQVLSRRVASARSRGLLAKQLTRPNVRRQGAPA